MVTLFWFAGFHGLDFGHHWDEPWFFLPLKRFASQGHLLPGAYNYPSVSYYLSYAAGLPELLAAWWEGKQGPAVFQSLRPHLDTFAFKLRTRALFLTVTATTVVWVFAALRVALRPTGLRSSVAAVAGTLLVVGSYEVSYHARWIAPDGPLLAASALTTWCLAADARATDVDAAARWRVGATIGAGLATGTKYTAGLLILSVLIMAIRAARLRLASGASREVNSRPSYRFALLGWSLAWPVVMFGTIYLMTTPGTLFDAELFLTHIRVQMKTYGGGFGAYTVSPGPDHLSRMLLYLGGSLWSRWPVVGAGLSAITAFGAIRMLRRQPWMGAALLLFPLLFVAYFSIQRTMIVRNLLVVVPPLAVAFGFGVEALWPTAERPKSQLGHPSPRGPAAVWVWRARRAAMVAVGIALTANLWFVLWAADTVAHRKDRARFTRTAISYIHRQPAGTVFVSPGVRQRVEALGERLTVSTASVAMQADLLVLETDEGFRARGDWPANVWNLTEAWFGPWEVHFWRYPTWDGDPRILVVTRARAEHIGLRLLQAPSSDRLR